MKLDGVIFDLDGTLGHTLPVCCLAFRRAFRAFLGRDLSDAEITAQFGPSEEGIVQRLVPDRWEACLETYLREYERAHAAHATAFPGIDAALRSLRRRGVRLAIVTGKGPHSAAISLNYLGLAQAFDLVETGSPNGAVKSAAIRRVLRRWGASPDRVAYVGDAVSDIEAARAAGVISLAAAWAPTASVERLKAWEPRAIFESVERFIGWIEANVGADGGEPRA
jgi:HAD superfamily hydrolase (TIGR01549 family)